MRGRALAVVVIVTLLVGATGVGAAAGDRAVERAVPMKISTEFVGQIAGGPADLQPYVIARLEHEASAGSSEADLLAGAILVACNEEEYQTDRCPRFPVPDHHLVFAFGNDAAGTTIWHPSEDPRFVEASQKFTDGLQGFVDRAVGAVRPDGTLSLYGGSIRSEAEVFGSQAGPNGFDLEFFTLTRIGFEVVSVAVASPGRDPNGDGIWTDISYSGFFVLEGRLAKDGCKDGGWASVSRGDGSRFRNQGDCIQFVLTGR